MGMQDICIIYEEMLRFLYFTIPWSNVTGCYTIATNQNSPEFYTTCLTVSGIHLFNNHGYAWIVFTCLYWRLWLQNIFCCFIRCSDSVKHKCAFLCQSMILLFTKTWECLSLRTFIPSIQMRSHILYRMYSVIECKKYVEWEMHIFVQYWILFVCENKMLTPILSSVWLCIVASIVHLTKRSDTLSL